MSQARNYKFSSCADIDPGASPDLPVRIVTVLGLVPTFRLALVA